MGWIERAYEEIESDLESGLIDKAEYNRQIKELQQEIKEEECDCNCGCSENDF